MLRYALLLAATLVAQAASAQTVRFTTTVGAFDMVLNPTNDPNLQPLVDNMIANLATGVYHNVLVNRADTGATSGLEPLLQLGSFTTDTTVLSDLAASSIGSPDTFDSVVVDEEPNGQVDFDFRSNTPGTVSLALSAGNLNSGSASFFVNVGDNSSALDPQGFVPFAFVEDLTTIDQIMAAPQVDIGPQIGETPGGIAFADVPLAPDGSLIVIESVAVVSNDPVSFVDPLFSALGIDPPTPTEVETDGAALALLTTEPPTLSSPGFVEEQPALGATGVPEPGTAALVLLAGLSAVARRQR